MATNKKPRVNFAQVRDARMKQKQDQEAPPPLPKDAADLYADGSPPDIPVNPPQAAPKPATDQPTLKAVNPTPTPLTEESEMPNRVEARVSEAELAVIRQVVRKEKGRRSKESGEPSGFNRQDLVREGLLAMCRELEPDFDAKVKKMTAVLKEVE